MSTLSNNKIYGIDFFFILNFQTLPTCPHFLQKMKGYKKERKHEIERQLLVHLSTLFTDILKGTRRKEKMK